MDQATETSNQAWKDRENGKPELSIAKLVPEIERLKGLNEESDHIRAIDLMVDLALSWKAEAKYKNRPEFVKTAVIVYEQIRDYAQKFHLPLRKDIDQLEGEARIDGGQYQKGIELIEKFLSQTYPSKEEHADPEKIPLSAEAKANAQSHIGFARAKLGDPEGINLLQQSLKVLNHPSGDFVHLNKDVYRIWKLGAQIKLAQLMEDKEAAKKLLEQVVSEADHHNLEIRKVEAQNLLQS